MELSVLLLVATFFIALISSILSGIVGGGGGFIMAPWQLLIGFSPVQMVASGSVGGSSMAIGSLLALKHGGIKTERIVVVTLSIIALLGAVLASFVLPRIDADVFKTMIAGLTLLSLPLFFSRHQRFQIGVRSKRSRRLGYLVLSLLIIIGSILFTSIFSLLIALTLLFFFGTSTLESTSIRRVVGLVQMVVLAILLHEHIIWTYTLITVTGGALGSYLGTRLAIKRGDIFAKNALAALAIVSALALLLQ